MTVPSSTGRKRCFRIYFGSLVGILDRLGEGSRKRPGNSSCLTRAPGRERLAAMTPKLRSDLLLLLAAAIWGLAFVAQRLGMEHVGPFTFNATYNAP